MADEIEAAVSDPTIGRRRGLDKRVQVIARMAAKRSWTAEQKIAILDEAFAPGACVSDTAERHELNTGQLYTWRRLFLDGKLIRSLLPSAPAFARIDMAPAQALASTPRLIEPLAAAETAVHPSGAIEIELKSGVRIRVDGNVNGNALKHVLDALCDR
jgi:transposase